MADTQSPHTGEQVTEAEKAIGEQILFEREDERRLPGYVRIDTAARALTRLITAARQPKEPEHGE